MMRLNQSDLQNFRKVFDIFDKDGNGSIGKDEIQQVFKQLNITLKKGQLNRIMLNFDASGDGSIQFEEFLQVVAAHFAQPQSEQWMFQVFEVMDQDCDGILSKAELMKVAKLYELEIEQKDVDLMIEMGDQHGSLSRSQRFSESLEVLKKKDISSNQEIS